jgi:DNA-damage-inducible protein D
MANKISKNNLSVFEQIRQIDEKGNEFWMARQLSKLLDYTDFRNFKGVIEKSIEACKNSGHNHLDHLVEANEVV